MGQGKDDQINTKDFLIGALIGAIAGAATALFLAPKSGKEMRNELNSQAIALKEKTIQLKDVALAKGNEVKEVAKEKTQSISQAVSKQSNEIINKVKNFKTTGEEVVEQEGAVEQEDIQKKLEETKKAFDETEMLLNQ